MTEVDEHYECPGCDAIKLGLFDVRVPVPIISNEMCNSLASRVETARFDFTGIDPPEGIIYPVVETGANVGFILEPSPAGLREKVADIIANWSPGFIFPYFIYPFREKMKYSVHGDFVAGFLGFDWVAKDDSIVVLLQDLILSNDNVFAFRSDGYKFFWLERRK